MLAAIKSSSVEVMLLDSAGLANGARLKRTKTRAFARIARKKTFLTRSSAGANASASRRNDPHHVRRRTPATPANRPRRRGMADADGLLGSPLPQDGVPSTWRVAASPSAFRLRQKLARDAAVVGILDHRARACRSRSAASPLAAELELVARVVDRPRAVGLHQHAVLDACRPSRRASRRRARC